MHKRSETKIIWIVIISLVMIAGLFLDTFGQQLITDDSVVLKKGIYKDFYEFKYNKPSLIFDYPVTVSRFSEHFFYLGIDRKTSRSMNEIFGFCDGRDIYLAVNSYYLKVSVLGKYCLLWYTDILTFPLPLGVALIYLPVATYDNLMMINMNTGVLSNIPDKGFISIIEDDPEICGRYLIDPHYRRNRAVYLKEYSLKHKNEIRSNPGELTTGEINEILQPVPADSTFFAYSERVKGELTGCSDIFKIEISSPKYKNGHPKFCGLRATHKYGHDPEYRYRIGHWTYYRRNGEIRKEKMFDLTGDEYNSYSHLVNSP